MRFKGILAFILIAVILLVCNFFFFLGAVKNTQCRVTSSYNNAFTNIVNLNTLYFQRLINDTEDMSAFINRFQMAQTNGDVDSCYVYAYDKKDDSIIVMDGMFNPHIYIPSVKLCIRRNINVYFDYISQDFYIYQKVPYNTQYSDSFMIDSQLQQGILIFYKVDFSNFLGLENINVRYHGILIDERKDIGCFSDIKIDGTCISFEMSNLDIVRLNKDMFFASNTIAIVVLIIILFIFLVSIKYFYKTLLDEAKVVSEQIRNITTDIEYNTPFTIYGNPKITHTQYLNVNNKKLISPIIVETNGLLTAFRKELAKTYDSLISMTHDHEAYVKLLRDQTARKFYSGYKDAVPDINLKCGEYEIDSYVYPLDSGAGDATLAFTHKNHIIGAVFDISGHGAYASHMAAKFHSKIKEEQTYGIKDIRCLAEVFLMYRHLLNDFEETIDICLFEINMDNNKITFLFFSQLYIVAKFKDSIFTCKDGSGEYPLLNVNHIDKLRRHSDEVFTSEVEKVRKMEFEWCDIEPGDTVIIFTDGFFEKGINRGELIGKRRLVDILKPLFNLSGKDIIRRLESTLGEICRVPDTDDKTICVIKRSSGMEGMKDGE